VRLEWETWADEHVAGFDPCAPSDPERWCVFAEAIPAGQNQYRDENVVPGTR
jgi:hypothetical protein